MVNSLIYCNFHRDFKGLVLSDRNILTAVMVLLKELRSRVTNKYYFCGGSVVKNPPAKAEDAGSIPGLGRSPGEGNDNPLQYCCLENSMDRDA